MESKLLIVADDRERSSGVLERLQAMPDVELAVRRLKVGDYEVANRVAVERKKVADFAASIIDGRLFAQAARLNQGPLRSLVVIEGQPRDLAGLGMRREALQGALISLTLVFGIPALRSMSPAETARLLAYAAEQVTRASTGARFDTRRARSRNGRRIQLLRTLPGIGRQRAEALLAAFGSVENCLSASEEELLQVEGVGGKTARAIRDLVSEATSPYGRRCVQVRSRISG